MELQKRKLQRMQGYDYSQNGSYFITICTYKHLYLFSDVINHEIVLNDAGKMVEDCLLHRANGSDILIDNYCIMPNHLHVLITLINDETTQTEEPHITLSELVRRFKTITTKLYIDGVKSGIYKPFDKHIWQKSFYDRIIRNEQAYYEAWKYIVNNPRVWKTDEYFFYED